MKGCRQMAFKSLEDKTLVNIKVIGVGGGGNNANMPTTVLKAEELTDGGIGILTVMVRCGLSPSNGEARRLVQQGGVSVNDTKITDPKSVIYPEAETILRKGKKVFHKVVVEE